MYLTSGLNDWVFYRESASLGTFYLYAEEGADDYTNANVLEDFRARAFVQWLQDIRTTVGAPIWGTGDLDDAVNDNLEFDGRAYTFGHASQQYVFEPISSTYTKFVIVASGRRIEVKVQDTPENLDDFSKLIFNDYLNEHTVEVETHHADAIPKFGSTRVPSRMIRARFPDSEILFEEGAAIIKDLNNGDRTILGSAYGVRETVRRFDVVG